jgi:hypothetical protein
VVEDGWKRSPTLRGQCEELARARAVVKLQWGKTDSQSRALSKLKSDIEGVVVADVTVPPVSRAVALVAHELEHVLERARGLDFDAKSRIPNSGVWRAFGGFETQGAIDIERRVEVELEDSRGLSGSPRPGVPETAPESVCSHGQQGRGFGTAGAE